jgi:hypothetical protein
MGGADQPLKLDSRKPTQPLEQFVMKEGRYAMLAQSDPARARQLLKVAQHDADARWQFYEQVAGVHRVVSQEGHAPPAAGSGGEPAPAAGQSAGAGAAPAPAAADSKPDAPRPEEAKS